jgi:transcription termination/antitermination protein NusA
MVVSELRGEKIDIIPYNDEPARFVAKALSPARVREVLVDDDGRQATVIVPDDQLSLAIGREGQNARLAARLTGWRIDIKSETEFATEEQDESFQPEETSGRCAAILANGRRCPNASLPGSRYCGLDSHQALAGTGSDYVGGTAPEELADEVPAVEETLGDGVPLDDGAGADDGAHEPAPEAAEPEALPADEPEPAEERTS